jgi:Tripartite tricarboxylate transporter TctB family
MLEGRLLVSAIMLVVFTAAVGLSFTYAPEARLLPLVIGIPGLLLCAIQLITELRDKNPAPGVTREEHGREGHMFAWLIGFVGALVLFGFLYTGPALVAAYLYFSGREKWYVALAGAVFAWTVLYGVFDWFLGLPLFDGLVFQYLFG